MKKRIRKKRILIIFLIIELSIRIYLTNVKEFNEFDYYILNIEGVPFAYYNLSYYDYAKQKPRILLIGDYITMHKGVEGKNIANKLEEKIGTENEIINFAASWYSYPEELSLIQNKGLDLNPDTIVVVYVLNDITLDNKKRGILRVYLKEGINQFKFLTPAFLQYINMKRIESNLTKFYENPTEWIDNYYNDYQDPTQYNGFENYLTTLSDIQKEKNISIIFTIIPIFARLNYSPHQEMVEKIFQSCEKTTLTCINTLNTLKNYNLSQIKEDDQDIWHPNSKGINIISQLILEKII